MSLPRGIEPGFEGGMAVSCPEARPGGLPCRYRAYAYAFRLTPIKPVRSEIKRKAKRKELLSTSETETRINLFLPSHSNCINNTTNG